MVIRRSKGFTLVELVTVITILAIVSVGIGSFVVMGTRIFIDSSLTDQVLSQSRYALQRMTLEIRTALPNSIRVAERNQTQCIEFVPTITSTSYLQLPFQEDAIQNSGVVFKDKGNTLIRSNSRIYVFPTSNDDVYLADSDKRSVRYAEIKNVNDDGDTLGLTFANAVQFAEKSPSRRAYVVSQPVSYCFNGIADQIIRYQDYGFNRNQPMTIADSQGSLLATNIVNDINSGDFVFYFEPASLVNNAIVQLAPRFSIGGEAIQYQHQVQVINVP